MPTAVLIFGIPFGKLKLKDKYDEEAKSESGWCKIRDGVVLPYALKVLVYLGKQVLTKTMENTVTAVNA